MNKVDGNVRKMKNFSIAKYLLIPCRLLIRSNLYEFRHLYELKLHFTRFSLTVTSSSAERVMSSIKLIKTRLGQVRVMNNCEA